MTKEETKKDGKTLIAFNFSVRRPSQNTKLQACPRANFDQGDKFLTTSLKEVSLSKNVQTILYIDSNLFLSSH
jgi:hypothetical protein